MLTWMLVMVFALLCGHALVDFGLQSEAMAVGKNRHGPPGRVPKGQVRQVVWPYWLAAHALMHGGMVWVVMGSPFLGLLETVAHGLIDGAKCEGWTTVRQDQLLHLLCKVAWILLAVGLAQG